MTDVYYDCNYFGSEDVPLEVSLKGGKVNLEVGPESIDLTLENATKLAELLMATVQAEEQETAPLRKGHCIGVP